MQLKFLKSNERNYSYDLFCNTFKRFYIINDRQAIVFSDTFFAPLSLLHSCPRNLYEVIRTLIVITSSVIVSHRTLFKSISFYSLMTLQ